MDINIDELQKICLDFFRLAGMGFSLWDENMHNIFSYPKAHCPFCEYVRTDEKLAFKCSVSDSIGLEEVNRTKKPFVYTCHMGLTEAIVPIMQDEEIAGYLMMGQILEEVNRDAIERCIQNSSGNKLFRQELRQKLSENVLSDSAKISYCINVLKVMIEYMNLSYVIKKSNESVYSKAKRYISDNISKQTFAEIGRNGLNFDSTAKDREFIIFDEKVSQIKRKGPLRARWRTSTNPMCGK